MADGNPKRIKLSIEDDTTVVRLTERESLLQQLQQEMSKSEGLRQQLLENQQSHQSIVDWVMDQNDIRVQEMSNQIQELTNQCQVFYDEKHNLTQELDQINEENACAICLSPWEAQGDHRIVSLPCGHLFGKECILHHLAHNSKCPLCNQEARLGDVRHIFGCRILPVQRQQAQASHALQDDSAGQTIQGQSAQVDPPPSRVHQDTAAQLAPRPVQQS